MSDHRRHPPLRSIAERDALLLANTGVIWKVARLAFRKPFVARAFQSVEETFQAGMLGAIRAAELYDPRRLVNGKPVKADTYIANSALKRIYREAGEQAGLIHVPARVLWAICTKQPDRLAALNGRADAARQAMMPIRSILSHEDGHEWLVNDCTKVDGDAAATERARRIGLALRHLPERMQKVIRMRFGLNGKEPKTLKEIGRRMGVTRERIRQIEKAAMGMLQVILEEDGAGVDF